MAEEHLGGGIEQLHYTWAPRGAEGINRFQIAAISAGLRRPPLVSLLPDLRRLCRYDRPSGGVEDADDVGDDRDDVRGQVAVVARELGPPRRHIRAQAERDDVVHLLRQLDPASSAAAEAADTT